MDRDDESDDGAEPGASIREGRSAARLAAVQALYQMDLTQQDLNKVFEDFLGHRFETVDIYKGADREFFRDLVAGAATNQSEIDQLIASHLAQGWKLSRIDSILRAILRSAIYEIVSRSDIPARVIISEYVEIAHDFFGQDEPGVVNGLLDRVARERRGSEFRPKVPKV